MSTKALLGTMLGDQSVYSGRALLGVIRPTAGGVHAYAYDGKSLGTFATRKAAVSVVTTNALQGETCNGE